MLVGWWVQRMNSILKYHHTHVKNTRNITLLHARVIRCHRHNAQTGTLNMPGVAFLFMPFYDTCAITNRCKPAKEKRTRSAGAVLEEHDQLLLRNKDACRECSCSLNVYTCACTRERGAERKTHVKPLENRSLRFPHHRLLLCCMFTSG